MGTPDICCAGPFAPRRYIHTVAITSVYEAVQEPVNASEIWRHEQEFNLRIEALLASALAFGYRAVWDLAYYASEIDGLQNKSC